MVSESSYRQSLPMLQDGRLGVQLERTFRLLAFLLHGWSTFTGRRKPLYNITKKDRKGNVEPLPVIHFEKLALFTSRIWKNIYDMTKGDIPIVNDPTYLPDIQTAEAVRFPIPFQEFQAKHGRRIKRITGYIVEILYSLQKAQIIYYFNIKPPARDTDNPNNYETTVSPGFPITNPKDYLSTDFSGLEVEILTDLDNCVKRLGPSQIRALGTHENRDKTIEDIHKEFLDMDRYIQPILVKLYINEGFFDDSYEMMTYADEAWRKSTYNRQDYEEACEIMLTEMKSAKVNEAFKSCQRTSAEIWEDETITALAEPSKRVKALTGYLHAVSYYRDHISERSSEKFTTAKYFAHLWDDSVAAIKKCGLLGFPSDIHDVFVGKTEKIKSGVCDRLCFELESLNLWIKENTKHAQRELCLSQDASGP